MSVRSGSAGGGSGATLGANTFTAGQTITEAVGASALTLTGATQTSSFPVINATQTWNAAGTTFTGWRLNVTNTASAAASKLMDLQVGGVTSAVFKKPVFSSSINSVPTDAQFQLVNGVDTLSLLAGNSYNSIIAANNGLSLVSTTMISVDGTAAASGSPAVSDHNGLNLARRGIIFGRHSSSVAGTNTLDTNYFGIDANQDDVVSTTLRIFAQTAYPSAVTNLVGGPVKILGGAGASGAAGVANGGDVYLIGGLQYGTGTAGVVIVGDASSASPVARTVQVGESSRSGTDTNVGGANGTIRAPAGTGTGTLSSLIFQTPVAVASGTGAQTQTTGLTIKGGQAVSTAYTVATLPTGIQGGRAHVTDANATLTAGIGAVVAAGGANVVPVFFDGTNWRIG